MTKIKPLYEIEIIEGGQAFAGLILSKGLHLFVTFEGAKAPFGLNHRIIVARVDNGTGLLETMPETAFRDTEVKFKKLESK